LTIGKMSAFELPPPDAGLNTVIVALPKAAVSLPHRHVLGAAPYPQTYEVER